MFSEELEQFFKDEINPIFFNRFDEIKDFCLTYTNIEKKKYFTNHEMITGVVDREKIISLNTENDSSYFSRINSNSKIGYTFDTNLQNPINRKIIKLKNQCLVEQILNQINNGIKTRTIILLQECTNELYNLLDDTLTDQGYNFNSKFTYYYLKSINIKNIDAINIELYNYFVNSDLDNKPIDKIAIKNIIKRVGNIIHLDQIEDLNTILDTEMDSVNNNNNNKPSYGFGIFIIDSIKPVDFEIVPIYAYTSYNFKSDYNATMRINTRGLYILNSNGNNLVTTHSKFKSINQTISLINNHYLDYKQEIKYKFNDHYWGIHTNSTTGLKNMLKRIIHSQDILDNIRDIVYCIYNEILFENFPDIICKLNKKSLYELKIKLNDYNTFNNLQSINILDKNYLNELYKKDKLLVIGDFNADKNKLLGHLLNIQTNLLLDDSISESQLIGEPNIKFSTNYCHLILLRFIPKICQKLFYSSYTVNLNNLSEITDDFMVKNLLDKKIDLDNIIDNSYNIQIKNDFENDILNVMDSIPKQTNYYWYVEFINIKKMVSEYIMKKYISQFGQYCFIDSNDEVNIPSRLTQLNKEKINILTHAYLEYTYRFISEKLQKINGQNPCAFLLINIPYKLYKILVNDLYLKHVSFIPKNFASIYKTDKIEPFSSYDENAIGCGLLSDNKLTIVPNIFELKQQNNIVVLECMCLSIYYLNKYNNDIKNLKKYGLNGFNGLDKINGFYCPVRKTYNLGFLDIFIEPIIIKIKSKQNINYTDLENIIQKIIKNNVSDKIKLCS